MKILSVFLPAFSMALVLISCAGDSPKTQQGLLKLAFEAIKNNEQEDFEALTITPAEIMIDEYDLKPFEANSSYIGQVIRPEEEEEQSRQFQQAVSGGPKQIQFQQSKFVGAKLIDSGEQELLSGSSIAYETYGLSIEQNGQKIESENTLPNFVITHWKEEYRVLSLQFSAN